MRAVGVILLISFLAGESTVAMPGPERQPLRVSVSDRPGQDWESVDFSLLEEELSLRDLDGEQNSRQVLFSLQFAFSNKLRTDYFLVSPQPQEFVGMVAEILKLNREVAALIVEGRTLSARTEFDASTRKRCKEFTIELGELSRSLKKRFVNSFLDPKRATLDVSILQEKGAHAFRFYLVQADRINRQLTEEIDAYFMGPNPGAVGVPDFGRASIAVLTEAMILLSEISRKWID